MNSFKSSDPKNQTLICCFVILTVTERFFQVFVSGLCSGVILFIFCVFWMSHGYVSGGICIKRNEALLTIQTKNSFENKSYPICAPLNVPKPQQTDIALLIVEDVSVF